MDKFPRLKKTVWVDKPTFQLADPNNPVTYRLKPQKVSPSDVLNQTDSVNKVADQKKQDQIAAMDIAKMAKISDPSSVVRELSVNPDDYYNIDDQDVVNANIEEIMALDVDDALDELDNLQEYDMTDNDRSIVQNEVLTRLSKQGKIDY